MVKSEKIKSGTAVVAVRLQDLRGLMAANKVQTLLISSEANRYYFSGFAAKDCQLNESAGCLLITSRTQTLFTDSRFTQEALESAPLFKVIDYRRGLGAELARQPAIKKAGHLAFEPDYMSVSTFNRLKKALPGIVLKALPFDPDRQRASKSPEEIKLIRKALSITEAALGKMFDYMEPGLTEREVAFLLEVEFKRLGAEGPSFGTIVASGPRGALPHAVPGSKKIKDGETVIIDCGARYQGYCADITRTKIMGRAKPWQREIYSIVRQAQLLAIEALAPGYQANKVDKIARDYIRRHGYGKYFGHSLGHGVGLMVHESPSLSQRNTKVLEPGEIVTVEPGIYLPNKGGVRLEQMVLITKKGHKVLNNDLHFYDFV